MSGVEVAALGIALIAAVLVGALLVVLSNVVRALMTLQSAVDELHRTSLPLMNELRHTVRRTDDELVRVDSLLGRAEAVSDTVDRAGRLATHAFANPFIRVASIGTGAQTAARRLTGRSHDPRTRRRRAAVRRSLRLGTGQPTTALTPGRDN